MKNFFTLVLFTLLLAACSSNDAPHFRIGDPGQTNEERDSFRDRGKVCTPELEAKGKC